LQVNEIKEKISIAEEAVENLAEPLKTKAFGVILSKLLEELVTEKSPKGEPIFVGEEAPRISGTATCREAIAKLFASDWGRKPRTIRQIVEAMKLSAVYYSYNNVAVELGRMTRIGLLRRLKEKEGFSYVSAKPSSP
jgi:hypothetical protein